MYELFDGGYDIRRVKTMDAQLLYIMGVIRRNVHMNQSYLRGSKQWLRNSHILSKLIDAIQIPMTGQIANYIDDVADRIYSISEVLQVTSPTSFGILHRTNQFYIGCDEVIMLDYDEFDWMSCKEHWREYQPVKILKHPFTRLSPICPNGSLGGVKGLAVISINVPMLMLQYRMWIESENDVAETKDQFLYAYPIVNAMESHMNIALMNRNVALFRKTAVERYQNLYPAIAPSDQQSKYDNLIQKFLANYQRKGPKLISVLDNMYSLEGHGITGALLMPSVAPTRQIEWATVIARLEYMEFLKDYRATMNNPPDQNLVDRLVQRLKIALNDSWLDRLIPQYEKERMHRIISG